MRSRLTAQSNQFIIFCSCQKMQSEEHQSQFECLICNQLILKPAMLPCKHEFCCYCVRSIKYKHEAKHIVCPLCRRVADWAPLNKTKELEVVKTILTRPHTRVFWGKGTTINDDDSNRTESRRFFYILMGNKFIGDIIWGGGSEHDTYIEEVGRCSGTVTFLEDNNFAYSSGYGAKYSNSPNEEWSGTFVSTGERTFALQNGRYLWHGWGKNSSGTLLLDLKQIKQGDDFSMYSNQDPRKMPAQARDQQCQHCKKTIFHPIVLPCQHEFCAFCLRSKFGQSIVKCPTCGARAGELAIDRQRETQIMKKLSKRPHTKVFQGTASTTNDYDKNLTCSQRFYCLLTNDYLQADIIWGGGTQHNTYVGEIGRTTGKVTLGEEGEFELGSDFGAVYTNTPKEEWFGSFKRKGNTLVLQKGRYNWHGWGRNSSGTLNIQLKQAQFKAM